MTNLERKARCGCGVEREPAAEEGAERDAAAAAAGAATVRHAVGVDPEIKAGNLRRLRRIEGQVRGLQRMVEEERYCADILTQVSSVQEALRAVGREVMRNHLRYCAAAAIREEGEAAEKMFEELVGLMDRH